MRGRYLAVLLVGWLLAGRAAAQPVAQPQAVIGSPAAAPAAKPAPDPAVPLVKLETIAPPTSNLGQPLQYQIAVRNIGSVPAYQVRVEDRLPPGARLRSAEPRPEIQGDHLAWSLGELAAGAEVRLRIEVEPAAEGEVSWSATVTYSATSDFTTRITRPRLTVTKTGPQTALVGDTATFQIQIGNTGSGPATGVTIRDQLPAGLQHPQGAVIEADIGTLAPGQTRSITLQTSAAKAGHFVNEVLVTADGGLQATARAEIDITQPALALRKTGPAQRLIGREAEFDLEVQNTGTADASNVRVVDTLPEGLDVATTNEGGVYDTTARTFTWTIGTLLAGQRRGLTLKTVARKVGDWTNRAVAHADRVAEVSAETSIRVDGVPALMLEVVDLDDPIEVGAETTYEIRVVNQGTCPATNLQILATVPDGMKAEDVQGAAEGHIHGQMVHFDPLPRLAAKADALYRVKVRGTKAGDWRFKVQMMSDQLQTPVREDESTRVYDDEND
jgi:uncharacterized repeat protein (TIGR01451 family)